jgi:hypothetical protein
MRVMLQHITRSVVAKVSLAESMELLAAYQGQQVIPIPALGGNIYAITSLEQGYTTEDGYTVSMTVHQINVEVQQAG